ncbi:MAG: ABC transporter ATP-binding protein, partial [Pseudomonadota bacterium]
MSAPLLEIRDLTIRFGASTAVDGVSLSLAPGETLALVGESGSGKSLTALSTVRLLPDTAEVTGSIQVDGREMLTADEATLHDVRGDDVSFIFQEPMTSLNPLHTVERQIGESLALHQGLTGSAARARTLELLTEVGIRDPETRLDSWPHQLSGGQRQRVMIAMALANRPRLLIADEPTASLDPAAGEDVMDLFFDLARQEGVTVIFISHNIDHALRYGDRVLGLAGGR